MIQNQEICHLTRYLRYLIRRPASDRVKTYPRYYFQFILMAFFLAARKRTRQCIYYSLNPITQIYQLTLKLFDHTVLPIVTYASEIFGFENLDSLERVHSNFLRRLL